MGDRRRRRNDCPLTISSFDADLRDSAVIEGPAAWIGAVTAVAAVGLGAWALSHMPDAEVAHGVSAERAATAITAIPAGDSALPARPGPLVLPADGDFDACRSVSGGVRPGLYCLVTVFAQSNDTRQHVIAWETGPTSSGPWSFVARDYVHRPLSQPEQTIFHTVVNLRAPSVIYVRAFATFDDAEPLLPRSAPSTPLQIDLAQDGSLTCPKVPSNFSVTGLNKICTVQN